MVEKILFDMKKHKWLNTLFVAPMESFHKLLFDIKKHKWLYIMLVIPVLFVLIWNYWPMYGVVIAFKDYSPAFGIWGSPWVGFKHFQRFFQ